MADVQRILDTAQKAMEQGDTEAMLQLYAEDAVSSDPINGRVTGKAAIRKSSEAMRKAFPDMKGTVTSAFGSGDMIAAEVTMRGTQTGPMELGPGNVIPASGKQIELTSAWMARVNPDGLIIEDRTYFDMASAMQQLGVLQQPGAAAA